MPMKARVQTRGRRSVSQASAGMMIATVCTDSQKESPITRPMSAIRRLVGASSIMIVSRSTSAE